MIQLRGLLSAKPKMVQTEKSIPTKEKNVQQNTQVKPNLKLNTKKTIQTKLESHLTKALGQQTSAKPESSQKTASSKPAEPKSEQPKQIKKDVPTKQQNTQTKPNPTGNTKETVQTKQKSQPVKASGQQTSAKPEDPYKAVCSKLHSLGIEIEESTLKYTFYGKPKAFNEFKKLVDDLEKGKICNKVKANLPKNGEKAFKKQLVSDTLYAISIPYNITQAQKGTCGATVVERALAERNPSEYIRLVRGLVTEGKVKLADGNTLELNPGGIHLAPNENDQRLLTSRILQPSFMDYADGKRVKYLDDTDRRKGNGFIGKLEAQLKYGGKTGLPHSDMAKLMSSVFNKKYTYIEHPSAEELKIAAKHSDKEPIALSLIYDKSAWRLNRGHFVELKDVNLKDKYVIISNPWAFGRIDLKDGKQYPNPYGGIESQPLRATVNHSIGLVLPEKAAEEILNKRELDKSLRGW